MDNLMTPHLTERLELATPLSFPLKYEYEKVNNTLLGLRDKELRGGEPEVPITDDYSPPDSDDDDDEDRPDKGPKNVKKIPDSVHMPRERVKRRKRQE